MGTHKKLRFSVSFMPDLKRDTRHSQCRSKQVLKQIQPTRWLFPLENVNFIGLNANRFKSLLQNLGLTAVSFLVVLLLAEWLLGMFLPFPNDYFTYTPNSGFEWELDPVSFPGLEAKSAVKFNAIGARSTPVPPTSTTKIVAIGGSTTACFAASQSLTWTQILQDKLGPDYWVGNFGRLGNRSHHHIQQVRWILDKKELQNTSTALVFVGVNDFLGYIGDSAGYLTQSDFEIKLAAFAHTPDSDLPWHRRRAFFKILKKSKQQFFQLFNTDDFAASLEAARVYRQQQPKSDVPPNLAAGLEKYEDNLFRIIVAARERGVAPVFITQPTLWHPQMSEQTENMLLLGLGKEGQCYSTQLLADGMEQFNRSTLKVCREQGVRCFDLATKIPKTAAAFYDDCHFTNYGGQLVAEEIYLFLRGAEK